MFALSPPGNVPVVLKRITSLIANPCAVVVTTPGVAIVIVASSSPPATAVIVPEAVLRVTALPPWVALTVILESGITRPAVAATTVMVPLTPEV